MSVASPSQIEPAFESVSHRHALCIACRSETTWSSLHRVLAQCDSCGFIRADLSVSADELTALYQEEYFQEQEYSDYLADRTAFVKNSAYKFRLITEIAGDIPSLFEIGSAYGFWLDYVSRQGIRCAGVDICEEPIRYAQDHLEQQAILGDFLQVPIQAGDYQTFCMWDTIEHLPHPDRFSQRIFDLLPSGGWFFLTTGDVGSKIAQRQGHRWRMIHPPTHLSYFSRETCGRMLEACGFQVVSTRSIAVYRSLLATIGGLALFGHGMTKFAAQMLKPAIPSVIQRNLGFWIDLGDIMLVAARKP